MSPKAIATFCAIPTAAFLLLIGILHSAVNVSGMRRAIERGDIPARFGDAAVFNALFSGLALSLLAVVLILLLSGLRTGSRRARNVGIAIGAFVSSIGVTGYLWSPDKPSVLIFLLFGALLALPLLIAWRRFSDP